MEQSYQSDNGYSGKLYGRSSLTIWNSNGEECLHTASRRINTIEELKVLVDHFADFVEGSQSFERF